MRRVDRFRLVLAQYIFKQVLRQVFVRPAGFILTAIFYGYAYYLQYIGVKHWLHSAPFEMAQTWTLWMWGTYLLVLTYNAWTRPLNQVKHILLKEFFALFPEAILQANHFLDVHIVNPAFLHRAGSKIS